MDVISTQRNCIRRMLNLNSDEDSSEFYWKVLVYDIVGRKIISPLLNIKQIRDCCVTLDLLLTNKKEKIEDVPAIYFMEPTKKNINFFLEDAKNDLYKEFNLNFISSISNQNLNYLANESIKFGVSNKIKTIYDQNINFLSFEQNLFSLNIKSSYKHLLSSKELIIDPIVNGLYNVCLCLKIVPIIKAKQNSFSEKVAKYLSKKISKFLENNKDYFDSNDLTKNIFQRPLLFLVDRNDSLPIMLHHSSTYQALIHNNLKFESNLVKFERIVSDLKEKKKTEKITFDLNEKDTFWAKNKGLPFNEVAESLNTMVKNYKELKNNFEKTSKTNLTMISTISELPKIRNQKMLADRHSAITTALSEQVSRRDLADFYNFEEDLMFKKSFDRKEMKRLLESKGPKLNDKIRAYLIFLLTIENPSLKDIEMFERILFKEVQSDSKYEDLENMIIKIKKCVGLSAKSRVDPKIKPSIQSNTSNTFSSISSTQFIGSLLDKGSRIFEQVKRLIPTESLLPITKWTKRAMENKVCHQKSSISNESFNQITRNRTDSKFHKNDYFNLITFDPKRTNPLPKAFDLGFREAIVFVIGGGNLAEKQNLEDFAMGKLLNEDEYEDGVVGKNIVYGSTELLNGEEFLDQLAL